MINFIHYMESIARKALHQCYNITSLRPEIQYTKLGDITWVIFTLEKKIKKSLREIGKEVGNSVLINTDIFESFQLIQGFLNFIWKDDYYLELFKSMIEDDFFVEKNKKKYSVMVEYSSPNTNKPLHLGHMRNILLGDSISRIFKANGKNVIKTQIINDRGIHICKSMIAWEKFSNGETPKSSGIKGDHFVGKYYVLFEKKWQKEVAFLCANGYKREIAEKKSEIMRDARETLIKWEYGKNETLNLWKKMNKWVYDGFDKTYRRLNVHFDEIQYESKTSILGRDIIKKGIENGFFFREKDGSIWVYFKGLEKKLLLRSDGTSLYITQDLGTTLERFKKHSIDSMIYVVGEEQNSHFQGLFLILKDLGYPWSIFHCSYGMVDLPSGKMKSREGTVVYADDLMDKMHRTARKLTQYLGKIPSLLEIIGIGALKYFILKVDPKKRILFHTENSIELKGNTATYIQYTYARIRSLELKTKIYNTFLENDFSLTYFEKKIIKILERYSFYLKNAERTLNPSIIANYVYDLAKSFNEFYQNINILNSKNIHQRKFRIYLSSISAKVIKRVMDLLGIKMLERM
ncbi:MAG TPA: arginine--tRNA ligase [Candidatus Angelobacter sp.]|nr:arginine--tRNA ligase [Candidatus Angelobacter sp.]